MTSEASGLGHIPTTTTTTGVSTTTPIKEQKKLLSAAEKKLSVMTAQLQKCINNGHPGSTELASLQRGVSDLKKKITIIKETIAETPASPPKLHKSRVAQLSQKLIAQLPKDHPIVTHDLEKRINETAKTLTKGSFATIHAESKHIGEAIILKKDLKGNLDILIPKQWLGKGTMMHAWSAISVESAKNAVFKTAVYTPSNTPSGSVDSRSQETLEDFDNAVKILNILNAQGNHRGIPPAISQSMDKSNPNERLLHDTFYSRGDFTSQSNSRTIANLFNLTPSELKALSPDDREQLINNHLQQVAHHSLTNEVKKLEIYRAIEQLATLPTEGPEGEENATKLEELRQTQVDLPTREANLQSLINAIEVCTSPEERMILTNRMDGLENLRSNRSNYNLESVKEASEAVIAECQRLLTTITTKIQKVQVTGNDELQHRFADILKGTQHIHECNILHGDIKPANFLWNEKEAVVADYGGSKLKNNTYTNPMRSPIYATRKYDQIGLACKKAGNLENWFKAGQASDMRAMGLSLVQIYTGLLPPENDDIYAPSTYQNIQAQLENRGMDPRAATLLTKMCNPGSKDFPKPLPADYPILPLNEAEYSELIALLDNPEGLSPEIPLRDFLNR